MICITLAPDEISRSGATTGAAQPDRAATIWNGHTFTARSAHGASMAVARQLVVAGCPDQPWQAVSPAGQRLLHGGSLHRLARLAVSETDGRTRIVPYAPDPRFPVEGADQDGGRLPDEVPIAAGD